MICGRCFAFLLVGGRFLFLRMVGGRCLNQYMVGGRWSVAGRWAVVLHNALLFSLYFVLMLSVLSLEGKFIQSGGCVN